MFSAIPDDIFQRSAIRNIIKLLNKLHTEGRLEWREAAIAGGQDAQTGCTFNRRLTGLGNRGWQMANCGAVGHL